jgi:hypothetical protein
VNLSKLTIRSPGNIGEVEGLVTQRYGTTWGVPQDKRLLVRQEGSSMTRGVHSSMRGVPMVWITVLGCRPACHPRHVGFGSEEAGSALPLAWGIHTGIGCPSRRRKPPGGPSGRRQDRHSQTMLPRARRAAYNIQRTSLGINAPSRARRACANAAYRVAVVCPRPLQRRKR